MKKWEFSSEDVIITPTVHLYEPTYLQPYPPNDMAFDLRLRNLQWPSVEGLNSALRFLYTEIVVEHPTIEGIFLGPICFGSSPPSLFFRIFNLISAQDELTIFLWGSLTTSSEELPLLGAYNSKFIISVIGPSARPNQIDKYWNYPGLITAWVVTFIDVFTFTLIDLLSGFKPSIPEMVKLYMALIEDVEDIVSAAWTSSNTVPQVTNAVIKAMVGLLNDKKVIRDLFESTLKIAPKSIEKMLINLTQLKVISVIVSVANLVFATKDLIRYDAYELYKIDLPSRRKPVLRADTTRAFIPEGGRANRTLELLLPEGYLFSFSEEPFQARVYNGAPQDQMYRFSDITIQGFPGFTVIPVILTLSVSQYGNDTDKHVGVRPKEVNASVMVDTYYFPNGLGKFIQGLQGGGGADVIAQIELYPGSYPKSVGIDRVHSVTIPVSVGAPFAKPLWKTSRINSNVGSIIGIELSVSSDFLSLDTGSRFIARIRFNPDGSGLELSEIHSIPDLLDPNPSIHPYRLQISASGTDANGKPLMRFSPKPFLKASADAGPVIFRDGLRDVLKMLRPGLGTLNAKIIVNPEIFDSQPQIAEATIPVNIDESIAQLSVGR